MKLDRGTINVFLMSIAFLMSVTCFTTVLNFAKVVQDALKDDYPNFRAHPYYTYILYEAFLCLGVLLAPVWLRCVTPKYTIVLTEFVTMFYPLQYLFPDTYLMYVASSVSGFLNGLGNVSIGTMLALNSSKEDMERNAALHWLIAEFSRILGNTIMLLVLGSDAITKDNRIILFALFTAMVGTGSLVALFLKKPLYKSRKPASSKQIIRSALRLLITKDMWLFMITFAYLGVLSSYQQGIYSTEIAYTHAFNLPSGRAVALNGLVIGIGETMSALLYVFIGHKIHEKGRHWVVFSGFFVHMLAYVCIFLNIPNRVGSKDKNNVWRSFGEVAVMKSSIHLAFFCSFLLGLGDSSYHTQALAALGIVFEREISAAYAIFKISQKVGTAAAYLTANYTGTYAVVGLLITMCILGTGSFVFVHLKPSYVSENPVLVNVDDESQTRDKRNADEVSETESRRSAALHEVREQRKAEKKAERETKRQTKMPRKGAAETQEESKGNR